MPAPGDQHASVPNPFNEPERCISEYTAQQIATLQSRLEKQLGPEYLSSRSGPSGQKVHYITAEKIISLANEVFGFNGWSSAIRDTQIDFFDEHPQTLKISLGMSVVVRVTLRDGTYHEDVGYGHIENCKGKAAAFEKAKKEGTTDALKRALRHFGNVLGNCIYDKPYLAKVTKIKVPPIKFDESRLHRHPDFAVRKGPGEVEVPKEEKTAPPVRQPPPPQLPTAESFEDFLGELDEADFNISDEGHPDEVVLPNSTETDSTISNVSNKSYNQAPNNPMHPPARQLARTSSAGNNPPRQAPQTPIQQAARPNTNQFPGAGAQNRGPPPNARPPQQQFNQQNNRPAPQPNNTNQNQNHNQPPQTHMTPPQTGGHNINHNNSNAAPPPGGEPVGFFSGRALKGLTDESITAGNLALKPGQVFNPRLESPSIPRTPGVDHSATKPLSRSGQHVPGRKTEEAGGSGISGGLGGGGGQGGGGVGGGGVGNAAARPGPGPGPGPRPGGGGPNNNMVNPQLDHTRRIGAPASSSPLGNRGQFRPLTVKRPAAGAEGPNGAGANGGGPNGAGRRVPLEDVSNAAAGGGGVANGGDLKRQRTS